MRAATAENNETIVRQKMIATCSKMLYWLGCIVRSTEVVSATGVEINLATHIGDGKGTDRRFSMSVCR